jgi:hypothetical protein
VLDVAIINPFEVIVIQVGVVVELSKVTENENPCRQKTGVNVTAGYGTSRGAAFVEIWYLIIVSCVGTIAKESSIQSLMKTVKG